MSLNESKIPRSVATHLVTSVCFFVLIVVAAARVTSGIEYYYSWLPLEQRELPWHAVVHFVVYQYAWYLFLVSPVWGIWLLSTREVAVRQLMTYAGVLINVTVAWGLWTAWTLYYLNYLDWIDYRNGTLLPKV